MVKHLIIIVVIAIFIWLFFYWQNTLFEVTEYNITSNKIEAPITIAQISDLHNKDWATRLYDEIEQMNPTYIVITGDLVDAYNPNIDISIRQIKDLYKIAPVFYVQGNHEAYSDWYEDLKIKLKEINVTILEDEFVVDDNTNILGLKHKSKQMSLPDNEQFTILLAHRPDYFKEYLELNPDLILSGHTHGGQIWLPIIGRFYAPNQGFFPEYISGEYVENDTTMIISHGLGNSSLPIRIFTPCELVSITILPEN